jgi:alkanesulfonate monooxygenase
MMAVEFFWRIPTQGDGRSVGMAGWNRGDWTTSTPRHIAPDFRREVKDQSSYYDYLAQVARAAELSGFDGALVPSAWNSEEPFLLSILLAQQTTSFRLLPAFQPAFMEPVYAAKMAATFQRISKGRLEWNVISGGSPAAQKAHGDFLPHDERYDRTGEFLDVIAALWSGKPVRHYGKFYQVENEGLAAPLSGVRKPGIYFSGASDAGLAVAAKHADVYLMWLEPLDAVRKSIERLDALASAYERRPRYGIRVDIFARETEAEAWADARRLWDGLESSAAHLGRHLTSSKGGDSVGAERQAALRPSGAKRFEDYIISPNLWAGLGLIRPGPTIGIFGSYQQVAERLNEYIEAGVDHFILAANPHLEEAYRVGEEVLPLLRSRNVSVRQAAE